MRKLLFKPKDRVATEDKNSIVYETDCCNCEAVYFGESKQSLKSRVDERKRSVRNCDCDKNEIKLQNTVVKKVTFVAGIRKSG